MEQFVDLVVSSDKSETYVYMEPTFLGEFCFQLQGPVQLYNEYRLYEKMTLAKAHRDG